MKNLLMIISLWAFASSIFAAPIEIKFSHVVSENTPKGQGALLFKKLVEERLAGKVVVEVFPRSSLYGDADEVAALINNDVQFIAPSISKFTQYNPQLTVFDLPFLFKDFDAVIKYWRRDISSNLLSSIADSGMVGLDFWGNGMKQITASREIRKPTDAAGLAFRIQNSEMIKKQYEAINVDGIPMAFAKSFAALASGEVQGTENTWSNIYTQNYQDVQPYMTETNHGVIGYVLVTNRKFWSSLPFDIKVELNDIIHEVTDTVNKQAKEINDQARQSIVDSKKTTIIKLTDEELSLWRQAYEPFFEEQSANIDRAVLRSAQIVNR